MNWKKLAVAAAFAAATAATAAPLRVATECTFPPFEYFDSKTGEITGFDMDLVKLLGKKIGRDVEIVSMGFDAIIPSLVTGTVDLSASGMTITPERLNKVNFTDPYFDAGLSILVRAKDRDTIRGINDLKGRDICVQIGNTGAHLAAGIEGATVKSYNGANEAFMELRNRGCSAVIIDRPVLTRFMADNKRNSRVFHLLPDLLQSEQYGIAVPKSQPELLASLNKALAEIKANGEYAELRRKWFGE